MFARRNLQVLSWVGHNIFGNLDGRVLNDPANKQTKLASKDHLLGEILGYRPQTLVSIEYIESLGDWKTAWDHIHFTGFLGTPMTLQFIWQGCDSLLAAPLVLDLIRFTELARRRGETGLMTLPGQLLQEPLRRERAPLRPAVSDARRLGGAQPDRQGGDQGQIRDRVGSRVCSGHPAVPPWPPIPSRLGLWPRVV